MAIQDENNQQNQTAAPQAEPQQAQRPVGPSTWSFHQPNLMNAPVAAGVGGEYFTKLRAAFAEVYKDIATGIKVDVLSLNRQNIPALKFSALLVVCRMPEQNNSVVAFHTLILEGTGEKLQPVVRTVDNQNIQINRVTSDAYDEVLYKIAYDAVAEYVKNGQVYPADAMVIPASIVPEKKEVIENIARNAALACVSVINNVTDNYGELNLAHMDRDVRFVIDMSFGNHQVYDVTGAPQRSSVLINYSSQKKTANQISNIDTVNVPDAVATICELSGFVNTIWAPIDAQQGFGFNQYNPNIPRPTQKFAAELVMTSVRTDFATSPAAVLLALSSSLALVDNNAWIQALLPRDRGSLHAGGNKVDITDIGALNITANLGNETDKGGFGSPISMAAIRNDLAEVNKYIVSVFRPGIVVSLDCPEVGPQSWYLSVFAAAASGDQNAYNQIYQAAMELTNGNFERFFKHGDPMFTNIVRVPLGYYMNGDQVLDIRNIDYTAIANLYQNNPQVIHEYAGTFMEVPGSRSSARNLAIREGIIKDALDQQCVINGYAARVSCSDDFIGALSAAIAECNLPVQVNSPLSLDALRTGVPVPSFVGQSLAQNTRTFSTGYVQNRPMHQYSYGRRHGGRY